jgi:hypothetical protein
VVKKFSAKTILHEPNNNSKFHQFFINHLKIKNYANPDCTIKAEKNFPLKSCGGLSDVFVCMRAAAGGIRMHTNTEQ